MNEKNENLKTRINGALVLKTSLEDFTEIKRFIESSLFDTTIVYQKTAPPQQKLFIREDSEGEK